MTRSELEAKHLSELHALAAEAGVPRYRMLRREELVEKLSAPKPKPRRERKPRQRRERQERPRREPRASKPPAAREGQADASAKEMTPEPRRRRRRRFGRKRKELRLSDLLTSGVPGRQAILYAETRAACTTLLREVATELAGESSGPDPVALLVDPSPEELAEWRREAPRAEIVAAAQLRHAEDALAQAVRRAESGGDVVVLIDSLTRLSEEFGDAEAAKGLLGHSLERAGSLSVVAALERR